MTRHFYVVNAMETAVLAETTAQLHNAGMSGSIELVYAISQQALAQLPELFYSLQPLDRPQSALQEFPVSEGARLSQEEYQQMKVAVREAISQVMSTGREGCGSVYLPERWREERLPPDCFYG